MRSSGEWLGCLCDCGCILQCFKTTDLYITKSENPAPSAKTRDQRRQHRREYGYRLGTVPVAHRSYSAYPQCQNGCVCMSSRFALQPVV